MKWTNSSFRWVFMVPVLLGLSPTQASVLDQSIRIRGSKPFGTAVKIRMDLAATRDSIFCLDFSGQAKRFTQTVPYPSDLSNQYFFFISNQPADFCEYRIQSFILEMSVDPPEVTYRSSPVIIQSADRVTSSDVHFGQLEKVDCRVGNDGMVACREQVGGKITKAGASNWWIDPQDFDRAEEWTIHLWAVQQN